MNNEEEYLKRSKIKTIKCLIERPSDILRVPHWIVSKVLYKSPLKAHLPWFTYGAMSYLENHLNKDSNVFEYGSGGSTLWLAKKVGHITSIEHNPIWYNLVVEALHAQNRNNASVILQVPKTTRKDDYTSAEEQGSFKEYVESIDSYPDQSFDLVVVDGRCREHCILHAMSKVKRTGIILLDDSYRERYQPMLRLLTSWFRRDFKGLKPFASEPSRTTILRAP